MSNSDQFNQYPQQHAQQHVMWNGPGSFAASVDLHPTHRWLSPTSAVTAVSGLSSQVVVAPGYFGTRPQRSKWFMLFALTGVPIAFFIWYRYMRARRRQQTTTTPQMQSPPLSPINTQRESQSPEPYTATNTTIDNHSETTVESHTTNAVSVQSTPNSILPSSPFNAQPLSNLVPQRNDAILSLHQPVAVRHSQPSQPPITPATRVVSSNVPSVTSSNVNNTSTTSVADEMLTDAYAEAEAILAEAEAIIKQDMLETEALEKAKANSALNTTTSSHSSSATASSSYDSRTNSEEEEEEQEGDETLLPRTPARSTGTPYQERVIVPSSQSIAASLSSSSRMTPSSNHNGVSTPSDYSSRSNRPYFPPSLDLPSRSASTSRVVSRSTSKAPSTYASRAQSRAHSPKLSAQKSLLLQASPSAFPNASPRQLFSPGTSSPLPLSSPPGGSLMSHSGLLGVSSHHHAHAPSNGAATHHKFRVHWSEETRLPAHIHPLKAHTATSSSTLALSSSFTRNTRPVGYFSPEFDPASDLILITGATGFLGSHVLSLLLHDAVASYEADSMNPLSHPRKIVCLVRPAAVGLSHAEDDDDHSESDSEQPEDTLLEEPSSAQSKTSSASTASFSTTSSSRSGRRPKLGAGYACNDAMVALHYSKLQSTFACYGLQWDERFTKHCYILPGDVSLPTFGVDSFHYTYLLQNVHTIFHLVNNPAGMSPSNAIRSLHTYSALKYDLVESMKRVLDFASLQRRKILVHVSSLDILRQDMSRAAKAERRLMEKEWLFSSNVGASPESTTLSSSHPDSSPTLDLAASSASMAFGANSKTSFSSSISSTSSSTLLASPVSEPLFNHANEFTPHASFSSHHLHHQMTNGFLQAKYVCEALMAHAYHRGLPGLIFRIGELSAAVGSQDSAIYSGNVPHEMDFVSKLMVESIRASVYPTNEVEDASSGKSTPPLTASTVKFADVISSDDDDDDDLDGRKKHSSAPTFSSLSIPQFNLMPVDEAARAIVLVAASYYHCHSPPAILPLQTHMRELSSLSSSSSVVGHSTSSSFQFQGFNSFSSSSSSGASSATNVPIHASGRHLSVGSTSGLVPVSPATPSSATRFNPSSLYTPKSASISEEQPVNPVPTFHLLHRDVPNTTASEIGSVELLVPLDRIMSYARDYGYDVNPIPISDYVASMLQHIQCPEFDSVFHSDLLSSGDSINGALLATEQILDAFQSNAVASYQHIHDGYSRSVLATLRANLHDNPPASLSHSIISPAALDTLRREGHGRLNCKEYYFAVLDQLVARGVLPSPESIHAYLNHSGTSTSPSRSFSSRLEADSSLSFEGGLHTPHASPPIRARSQPNINVNAVGSSHHNNARGEDLDEADTEVEDSETEVTEDLGGISAQLTPPALNTSDGVISRPLPTPSAFLSPNPQTVLSFLSPQHSDESARASIAGAEGGSALCTPKESTSDASSNLPTPSQRLTFSRISSQDGDFSPSHAHHHEARTPSSTSANTSFDATTLSPNTDSKSSPNPAGIRISVHAPQSLEAAADEDAPTSSPTATTSATRDPFHLPSTPPMNAAAREKAKKRAPPVAAGSRSSINHGLPHISTAASRRRAQQQLHLFDQQDGSAPVVRTSRAMSSLSSVLSSPSPVLGALNSPLPAVPNSAPFSALDSSIAPGAGFIDADAFKLALEGESSLMAALNSAAKKGKERRKANGDADEHGAVSSSAASSSSLQVPFSSTRTLSAPVSSSPLQVLHSPMLMRARPVNWATEILPHLYLGTAKHAYDLSQLRAHGITHIINAADDVPNYHQGAFEYLNLHVADGGLDKGIRRVFSNVEKFVRESGYIVPLEPTRDSSSSHETAMNASSTSTSSGSSTSDAASTASSTPSTPTSGTTVTASHGPPVCILVHCAKGANRSVTVVLALLMQLYPWNLDRAHAHLLHCKHPYTAPFQDNRAELLKFELARFGTNSMHDKDFLTRFAND